MRFWTFVAVCGAIVAAQVASAQDTTQRDLFASERVRGYLAGLVQDGGMGRLPFERAAFVTMDADGEFHCVAWPRSGARKREEFHGVIPAGTIAIAHTHPIGVPDPSAQDRSVAQRLGLPLFVATPRDLRVVTPDGATLTLIDNRLWVRAAAPCRNAEIARR